VKGWVVAIMLVGCKPAATPVAKPTRVSGVGDGTAFEVAVPDEFRVKLHDEEGQESAPHVTLEGPGLDVYVEMMSNAPMSFDEAKTSAGASLEEAVSDEPGWRFFSQEPMGRYEIMAMQPGRTAG
jgi:hypothetical protein